MRLLAHIIFASCMLLFEKGPERYAYVVARMGWRFTITLESSLLAIYIENREARECDSRRVVHLTDQGDK